MSIKKNQFLKSNFSQSIQKILNYDIFIHGLSDFIITTYLVTSLSLMQFMLQGVETIDDIFSWQKSMHSFTWTKKIEHGVCQYIYHT